MRLKVDVKPFSFRLIQTLITSQGILKDKKGWLLRIESQCGHSGWGEVSPLYQGEWIKCQKFLKSINKEVSRQELEAGINIWPGALAFGIGAALAELDGLIGSRQNGWLKAPQSAFLLPKNQSLLETIDSVLQKKSLKNHPITFKWKIAIESFTKEKELLFQILERLPSNARLRIDANAGLNRIQAQKWADILRHETRLEWLEQPLHREDFEGLNSLAKQIPVALDESLYVKPSLRKDWQGWQIRRPLLEGDPRILLKELEQGVGYRMVSTGFETGIGLRWVHHLAALQQQGPTPTAPGLAPGWCPQSPLFNSNPMLVWEAL